MRQISLEKRERAIFNADPARFVRHKIDETVAEYYFLGFTGLLEDSVERLCDTGKEVYRHHHFLKPLFNHIKEGCEVCRGVWDEICEQTYGQAPPEDKKCMEREKERQKKFLDATFLS